MGKQARLRKERKAKGGVTGKWVARRRAFEVQGDGWKGSGFLDAEAIAILAATNPDLDRILTMNHEGRFDAILHWVRANHENVMVELCAAFILMNTPLGGIGEKPSPIDDDLELKWLRQVLLLASDHNMDAPWEDAGWRVLKHMPIPNDDSDLLHPFEEMPVVSDPDVQVAIMYIQTLLYFRPSVYFILGAIIGWAFGDKNVERRAFVPLRYLLESEQADKLWKALDEMELNSDSETQANVAHFLKWLPYDLYLRSPHWKRVRNAALERAHHRCQVCNATGRLEVHHRTYDRRGQELLEDVTVLCRNCHETFHRNGRLTKDNAPFRGVGAGGHGL